MIRFLPLVLLLAGCIQPPTGWTVLNGTSAQEAEAQALVAATRAVTGQPMPSGVINLVTKPYGLDGTCNVPPPYHVAGCSYGDSLAVLIMPPLLGPDLTATALPHELCHAALGAGEAQANACGAKVVIEYQKSNP